MDKDIQLTNRMKAVVDMVDENDRVCDVGCDHGYMSIYLVKNGISPSALAMDINEGPLDRALDNIKAYGLEDKIKTRLSNGLMKYNEGEADTLIIAGMGGPLINSILSYDMKLTKTFNKLVLSPQSEIEKSRIFLYDNGFRIVDEEMVLEDGKFYVIMKCERGEGAIKPVEALFGPGLIEKKHPVLLEYLKYEKRKNEELLCKLEERISQQRIEKRISEIKSELNLIDEALGLMG